MKLGKKPFVPDPRDLQLSKYLKLEALPTIPDSFGHDDLIKQWGMLGNDIVGDCVIATGYHLTMLWNKMAGKDVLVTSKEAIDTYSKITGFNPHDPSTDRGTNMREFLKHWKKHGIEDASGKVHKIDGFMSVDPKNIEHLKAAIFLFGAVNCGMLFPDSAMDQFNKNESWTVDPNDMPPTEGHCIPLVHYENVLTCVTWGKEQSGTVSFWNRYLDEAWVVFSKEMLIDNCNLEGFLWQDLLKDVALLK